MALRGLDLELRCPSTGLNRRIEMPIGWQVGFVRFCRRILNSEKVQREVFFVDVFVLTTRYIYYIVFVYSETPLKIMFKSINGNTAELSIPTF